MKKIKYCALCVVALFVVVTSCTKRDVVAPISLTIQTDYSEDDKPFKLPTSEIIIKLTNLTSGQSFTAVTDAKGKASFASIAPGNYSISATKTFTAQEYISATGITVLQDVTFNASASQSLIQTTEVKLVLESGRVGDLVFKQIYYAGSNTSTGALFRDQFIEIYNNSNKTIYADSLYFGNSYANMAPLSNGNSAYDWSQSAGMPSGNGDPNKDFIYARYLFMIPGSGKDYPIEPGKSIIIAATALDHTKPFTGNDGKPYAVKDPSLTVDLSKADFESYLVEYLRAQSADPSTYTPYMWDIDVPNVPNVATILVVTGKIWVLDALGRDDFFMFKTSENVGNWPGYAKPGDTPAPDKLYKQIPIKHIIDAVEVTHAVENKRSAKRIPVALDGAPTFVTGGQYSSQSIVRKTAKTLEGRRILQDTNNSENDFFTKTKADPSKSENSFSAN